MTDVSDYYEDFSGQVSEAGPSLPPSPTDAGELEKFRLDSFEKGYRAGWEDAISAEKASRDRISSDLAQNLQDLSFTYHEAMAHASRSFASLMSSVVEKLLPAALRETVGLHILDVLQAHAKECAGLEVRIAVSSDDLPAAQAALEGDFGFPVRVLEDPQLFQGQADIRFKDQERRLDLTSLANEIIAAVDAIRDETSEVSDAKHA